MHLSPQKLQILYVPLWSLKWSFRGRSPVLAPSDGHLPQIRIRKYWFSCWCKTHFSSQSLPYSHQRFASYAYKMQLTQKFLPTGHALRRDFTKGINEQQKVTSDFVDNIFFSDWAYFSSMASLIVIITTFGAWAIDVIWMREKQIPYVSLFAVHCGNCQIYRNIIPSSSIYCCCDYKQDGATCHTAMKHWLSCRQPFRLPKLAATFLRFNIYGLFLWKFMKYRVCTKKLTTSQILKPKLSTVPMKDRDLYAYWLWAIRQNSTPVPAKPWRLFTGWIFRFIHNYRISIF